MSRRSSDEGSGRRRLARAARIARHVHREMVRDRVTILAAALAFYALLSLFPTLLSLVSLYALLGDPTTIENELAWMSQLLPPTAGGLVRAQLDEILRQAPGDIGLSLALSLGVVLWSSSTGVTALLKGVSLAYFADESRSFWRLRLVGLGVTAGVVLALAVGLLAVTAVPEVLAWLLPAGWPGTVIVGLRWPVLALTVVFGLELLYRYGPDRGGADADRSTPWRGPSPGAWVATASWLVASFVFSAYVERFGTFAETYGALGAAVVLLLWLFLGSFSALLGAELNAVLEREGERPEGDQASRIRGGEGGAFSEGSASAENTRRSGPIVPPPRTTK